VLSVLIFVQVFLVFISRDHIFFWDTVQFAAKHGLYFFDNGMSSFLLPKEMDSGHPPFFGMYQAFCWNIFGLSLPVSHYSMVPFLVANIIVSYFLGYAVLGNRGIWFSIILCACPFYIGHSILVSPDIILISGFLICLLGIIREKSVLVLLGSVILCIISIRGFALAGTLMVWQLFLCKMEKASWKAAIQQTVFFLPGILLFSGYQGYHYYSTQWVGFHSDSPWSPSFEIATIPVVAKNILLYIWRLCDFSMFAVWLIILLNIRTLFSSHRKFVLLLLLLVCALAILVLPFEGLMNHRYFLPIQLTGILLALLAMKKKAKQLIILISLIICSGNFWVYPEKTAQGWDATLAHYPFYKLQENVSVFVEQQSIYVNDIGTAFPMKNSLRHLALSSSAGAYKAYDINQDMYILYSNIMNDFSDAEINILDKKWDEIYQEEIQGVFIKLYKRR